MNAFNQQIISVAEDNLAKLKKSLWLGEITQIIGDEAVYRHTRLINGLYDWHCENPQRAAEEFFAMVKE